MRQRPYQKYASYATGPLYLLFGIALVRDPFILGIIAVIVALWYSFAVCNISWITEAEPWLHKVVRGTLAVCIVWLISWAVYGQICCYDKREDSKRDLPRSDVTVDLTFRVTDAFYQRLSGKTSDTDIVKALFCQSSRMYFDAVLIPTDNPFGYAPVGLIIKASNFEQPCDLKSYVAVIPATDKNPLIPLPLKVVKRDPTLVTIEAELFGYILDEATDAHNRYTLNDYGRPAPIYSDFTRNPVNIAELDFFPPMGLSMDDQVEWIVKMQEQPQIQAFRYIDVRVRPNPRDGWLDSSWTLEGKGLGLQADMALLQEKYRVKLSDHFRRSDDSCWLDRIRDSIF